MKVILAETAGFCMGVRRAMEIALETARHTGGPVFTQGPLIHNTQATDFLRSCGIEIADEAHPPTCGTLILRAHGVAPAERRGLEAPGLRIIDATCPHVVASQKRIRKYSGEGYEIVLAGDPDHPEMRGLAGHATTTVHAISTANEARSVSSDAKLMLIAQTTFNAARYEEIKAILRQRYPDILVFDSICDATDRRQQEAKALAESTDALVVVGGRHSANTTRLAEIGKEAGKPTFHIETADELRPDNFCGIATVGVTAGASTPGWVTEQVLERLSTFSSSTPRNALLRLLRWAVRTYVFTAAGAAALTVAIGAMLGNIHPKWQAPLLAAAYVFAAYVMNRNAPAHIPTENLSPTDRFLRANRLALRSAAGVSLVAALGLSWQLSPFALAGVMIACGGALIYAAPLFPGPVRRRRIKDLPASKDLFVAVAWACVLSGATAVSAAPPTGWTRMLLGAVPVFLLILSRTILLDLHDIDGDRMIGRETLPVLLGKPRAVRIAYGIESALFTYFLLLAWAAPAPVRPGVALFLLTLPLYGFFLLGMFRRPRLVSDLSGVLLTDARLYLAGMVWIWEVWA